jgi:hypothetical protein
VAFTLKDYGTAVSNLQTILYHEYFEAFTAAIDGRDCCLSGLDITSNSNMVPSIAKGAVLSNGTLFAVAAATVTVSAAHATLNRIDLIVIDSAGAKQVRAGTAAAVPAPPDRTANDVLLYAVWVPATATNLAAGNFMDLRCYRTQGPILLKKTTTAVTRNNDNAIYTYFTVTLPSGLLAAGKIVRVTCGGNYVLNSGTPTLTLTIAYGGTTLFADVSVAGSAGTGRGAWQLNFDLVHSASNAQTLNGRITYNNTVTGGRVNPTTGVAGDILGSLAVANRMVTTALSGAAGTVDSDAADRALTVQWTMSVANSADEIVMQVATAELL